MKWCVLYFLLDTHAPAPVPPIINLTMEDAKGISKMEVHDNWRRGFYAVAQPCEETPQSSHNH